MYYLLTHSGHGLQVRAIGFFAVWLTLSRHSLQTSGNHYFDILAPSGGKLAVAITLTY